MRIMRHVVASSLSHSQIEFDGTINASATNDILFAKGSGELSGDETIVISDTVTAQQKTLTINKYGAITAVN